MYENFEERFGSREDILDRVQDVIFPGEIDIEGTGYERGLLDRRIEKYLDKHFDEYINEYGLIRELDIVIYEENFDKLVDTVKEIKEFQADASAKLAALKRRLDRLESEI